VYLHITRSTSDPRGTTPTVTRSIHPSIRLWMSSNVGMSGPPTVVLALIPVIGDGGGLTAVRRQAAEHGGGSVVLGCIV